MEIGEYRVKDTAICHGKPVFKGTRVMVWQVLELVENDVKLDQILKKFPSLRQEHVNAALQN